MTTPNPSEATSLALNTITSQIRLLADMPAEHCKQAAVRQWEQDRAAVIDGEALDGNFDEQPAIESKEAA